MPGSDEGSGVGRRRNGKQQACEPCRKLKLACDHAAPFCGRCVRRKMTSTCVYHPAPMTRSRVLSRPLPPVELEGYTSPYQQKQTTQPSEGCGASQPSLAPGPSKARPAERPREFMSPEVAFGGGASVQNNSKATDAASTPDNWKTAVFRRSATYYGPTNFLAVFSEHQDSQPASSEPLLNHGEEGRPHPGAWVYGQPLLGRSREATPTARFEMVIKTLRSLPSKAICDRIANQFKGLLGTTFNAVMMHHFISSLWSTFGEDLDLPRSRESLLPLADALFRNEQILLPLDSENGNGMDWLDTFMGPNVRFEMLGILFTYIGIGYICLQDWDPLFTEIENKGRDRREAAWRMKECSDICLKMCDYTETVNVLVCGLQGAIIWLESGCTGDESALKPSYPFFGCIFANLYRLPIAAKARRFDCHSRRGRSSPTPGVWNKQGHSRLRISQASVVRGVRPRQDSFGSKWGPTRT